MYLDGRTGSAAGSAMYLDGRTGSAVSSAMYLDGRTGSAVSSAMDLHRTADVPDWRIFLIRWRSRFLVFQRCARSATLKLLQRPRSFRF